VYRRQRRREVGVAFVGDQHDGPCLRDREVRAADADRRVDELLAQRCARVLLDRLDCCLRAEHVRRVFFREVNRGRDEMRRTRMRELHHPLAEVGLDDFHAQRFEEGVELDLLGRHRLDLGDDHPLVGGLPASGVPADLGDDVARFGRVLGEMDRAAHRLEPRLELLDELRQAVKVGSPSLLQVGASSLEVKALERFVAPRSQSSHRLGQRSLEVWVAERLVDAVGEVPPAFRHAS
jgi:hypothetical protein